jgi:hypothetical protein
VTLKNVYAKFAGIYTAPEPLMLSPSTKLRINYARRAKSKQA